MAGNSTILTIGYGRMALEIILERLREHATQYLIDVRASPFSRFNPDFSRPALQPVLEEAGITYVHMGEGLGGRPTDPRYYDDRGRVDYVRLAELPAFQHDLERLIRIDEQRLRAVLMCSEGKPELCHRSKLIGVELAKRGIKIGHIDPDGAVIDQETVIARLTGGQLNLLEEATPTSRSSQPTRIGKQIAAARSTDE
jgi:uncharacterized protein (DUF488 family)